MRNTYYLLLLLSPALFSQPVTWTPAHPTLDDTITVIYDAAQGNRGLLGETAVYAHTGLITEKSTKPSDWRYVKTSWGQNTPETRLTSLGDNKWQLKFHIRRYYGVPASEKILQLAFVFRSADGSRTGKTATGGDIFIPVYQDSAVPQPAIKALPPNLCDGVNHVNSTTVTLVLYAPYKNYVHLIGDFNDWQPSSDDLMHRTPDSSRYWLELTGLQPEKEVRYQYLVDGYMRIACPYAEKVLDPHHDQYIDNSTYPGLIDYPAEKTTGVAGVLTPGKTDYPWQNKNFRRPKTTDLVIYELLIRDFVETHSLKTLTDTLGYFKKLGINAIELMPVNEFQGNISWGYNPSFYFAPDKYYGPARDLKRFIDAAHENGIAVIQDIVLNHAYGECPLVQLYADEMDRNPWFNVTSPNPIYAWGYDFDHQSRATQDFVDRVTSYWLTEYNMDGFRLDFTKGFTNTPGDGWAYDRQRIGILKRLADHIWSVKPGAFVILEHFCTNQEEKELSDYGMLLWGNLNSAYNEATMGYHTDNKSDFSGVSYVKRGWDRPHLVGYMESHDEQRLMFKNLTYGAGAGGYSIQSLPTALQRMQLAAAFFFTIPGPKMIWQFGELGYEVDINENGRTGRKPIKWDYYQDPDRRRLFEVYSALVRFKIDCPAFESNHFELDLEDPVKRIVIHHDSVDVVVLGNFDIRTDYARPEFTHTGRWYEFFSGDSMMVKDPFAAMALQPGACRLYTDKKIEVSPQPSPVNRFYLYPNYPNPFNTATTVRVDVAQPARLEIDIFNAGGQYITSLADVHQQPGQVEFEWPGTDNRAQNVGSGLYFCRVKCGNQTKYAKMLLVR